ncbi:unnamed protein product [Sphenostylis stenocarpa]|uniref:Uncharacterized protein n=1 Tax=Sphenostylis stenocarpa TaxID=92480 RepID=A0AA86S184_9FABA|nr:unnamed protein product [Sphenostylis stenocarpa]
MIVILKVSLATSTVVGLQVFDQACCVSYVDSFIEFVESLVGKLSPFIRNDSVGYAKSPLSVNCHQDELALPSCWRKWIDNVHSPFCKGSREKIWCSFLGEYPSCHAPFADM